MIFHGKIIKHLLLNTAWIYLCFLQLREENVLPEEKASFYEIFLFCFGFLESQAEKLKWKKMVSKGNIYNRTILTKTMHATIIGTVLIRIDIFGLVKRLVSKLPLFPVASLVSFNTWKL